MDRNNSSRLLTADIGGTKSLLAIFDTQTCALDKVRRYENINFSSPEELLDRYLHDSGLTEVDAISLAIAAPITPGAPIEMLNLPWKTGEEALSKRYGARVNILNDLEACVYATPQLDPQKRVTLQEGSPLVGGPVAWLSPGTGLGESFALTAPSGELIVQASEGGQADYAPQSPLEVEFLTFLQSEAGFQGRQISYEAVLSGPGLLRLYRFFCAKSKGRHPELTVPEILHCNKGELKASDESPQPARQALEFFLSALGKEAGNLALRTMAFGGIFLGGGILPQIPEPLLSQFITPAFCQKESVPNLMKKFPLILSNDPHAPLLGAGASFVKRFQV